MKRTLTLLTLLLLWLPAVHGQCLSGIYTIGGTNPHYTTLTSAVNSLITNGVCGAVTFNIRPGTYTEQVTIPQITGTSPANTITFRSETGDSTTVMLTYAATSAANYTLQLDGADHVTFERITISATGAGFARVIEMRDTANHCGIHHCVLQGAATAAITDSYAVIYAGAWPGAGSRFTGNRILNGSYGILCSGPGPWSLVQGASINNNVITGQSKAGIYAELQDSLEVRENVISSLTTNTNSSYTALSIAAAGAQVIGNRTSQAAGVGAVISTAAYASGARSLVANNFFQAPSTAGHFYYCSNTDAYYNSFHSTGANVNGAVRCENTNGFDLRNNNIASSAGGSALRVYPNTLFTSDHNNLYTSTGVLVTSATAIHQNLAAWQNTSGQDMNSVSVTPGYVSATDLHSSQVSLYGYAQPVSVTVDIDGDPRIAPVIGADEFSIPFVDAGAALFMNIPPLCRGVDTVKVRIRNMGASALTSASIHWMVNNVAQATYSWTGSLLTGDHSAPIAIGTFNFDDPIAYTVKAYTANPNNTPDPAAANDTAMLFTPGPQMRGIYTVGGVNPDFNTVSAAVDALDSFGVCGPVVIDIRDGVYNEHLHLTLVAGVSAVNTITFRSESGDSSLVTLNYNSGSNDNHIIYLDGAEHVTIRGLTLKALNPAYSNVIRLYAHPIDITITNCVLEGSTVNGSDYHNTIIQGVAEKLLVKNCIIRNGYYGTSLQGTANAGQYVFDGNQFIDQVRAGMYFFFADSIVILRNTITGGANSQVYFAGIQMGDCSNNLRISYNKILPDTGYGIYLASYYPPSGDSCIIDNNFIKRGLHTYLANRVHMYYNTIFQSSLCSYVTGAVVMRGSPGLFYLFNNIIVNTCGGATVYRNAQLWGSDHNNIYNNNIGALFVTVPTHYYTVASWQAATGLDMSSISADPLFVSSSDLHVSSSSPVIGQATPFPAFNIDIDGEPRDPLNPDMGADEHVAPTGTQEAAAATDLLIYPNPSTGLVTLQYKTDEQATVDIEVFNSTGQRVISNPGCHAASGINTWELKINNAGAYLVKVQAGETLIIRKVIVTD